MKVYISPYQRCKADLERYGIKNLLYLELDKKVLKWKGGSGSPGDTVSQMIGTS